MTRKMNLAIFIIVSLLVASCFTLKFPFFTKPVKTSDNSTQINVKSLKVWHVGSGNDILDKVLDKLQQLGCNKIEHLEVQELLMSESFDFNESFLIIFDGNWISERVDDPELHKLFREVAYKGVKLVAIGGKTSKLLEALDKAGLNKLARDDAGNIRNPAYFDPTLVGFKLVETYTSEGHLHTYPSILISNTTNINTLVQELINW